MKKITWVVLLVVSSIALRAQHQHEENFANFHPRFEIVTLPVGSLGNSVQGMVQDSTGFLWFATQGGLIRFDGQNFEVYRFDPNISNSLSRDYIESVFLDSKGILWLTHWQSGGLTSFDPENGIFTRYQHNPDDPESLSGNTLSVVTEDTQGYLWIGGDQGLNRFDRKTGKFKRFQHNPDDPKSLSYDRVRSIYVDRQGTLWVGTGFPWDLNNTDGGLNRYHPESETFTRYLHEPGNPESLVNNKVRALLEDSKGNFWVGTTGDGLHMMDREKGTFKHLSYDPENPAKLTRPYLRGQTPSTMRQESHVASIFEDQKGRIWITAVYSGLTVYDPVSNITHRFEQGTGKDSLTSNFLWMTYQTRDGTVWICSGGDGQRVFRVKEQDNLFPFYATPPRPDDHLSFSHGIVKDQSGYIWIAHENPVSLRRVDRSKNSTLLVPFGDPKNPVERINSLSIDNEGNLWIGTDKGQFRGNPELMKFVRFQPEGVSDDLLNLLSFPVFHSSSGLFWFGSWTGGLSSWDPETDQFINYRLDPNDPKSLGGNIVWGLYEDSKGMLWVGGGNPFGNINEPLFLDRFNPESKQFEHFLKSSQELGMATDITEDKDGNIWFTDWSQGLQKLDPKNGVIKKFSPFNSLLPASNLYCLLTTEDKKFWLSSQNNLIEFDPETETMSVYNDGQGVVTARDYYNSGYISEDGELLFSRMGGIHAFYPEQLLHKKNQRIPDIRITGFFLLGEENSVADGSIKEKPIWQTSSIRLAYDQNIFSLAIACFDFYDASSVQLQFQLEGYDKVWRKNIRNGDVPSYINVPPGEYTFRVRGANSFGIWNMEGDSLKIIILPPWWKSWWAYTAYGLIVLIGIFLFDRLMRQRIIQKERGRLMERELEQAREIEKAYTELKATQAQLIESEKMASLGELTAGIAHEIQNPLNFVNNFSEVNTELIDEMQEELKSGRIDEAISISGNIKENEKKISYHGKRADAIVKGMLQHSRNSSGQKEPTDINALADEYLRLAYHGLRAKDKTFNAAMFTDFDNNLSATEGGTGLIHVVPQDIGRVILNLITNAFHAVMERKKSSGTGYEPSVSVHTKRNGGKVEIRVKDNGNGIPENIKSKIFQPFFTTKPSGQGTGLGLSLSYDIVKLHGGELKVKTTPGEGTEFIIILPQ